MKKVIISAVFLFFFVIFFQLTAPVYGQGSLKSLGLQTVGLLPSNPFYFIKQWSRSIQRALTADAFAKIKFNWNVVNEQAGELKKLSGLKTTKASALARAADNYAESARQFTVQAETLREAGSTVSGDVFGEFLNVVLDRSLKHAELLEELAYQFRGEPEFAGRLPAALRAITDVIAIIPQKVERFESFRTRMYQVIKNQDYPFKELKAAAVLDRLETRLPEGRLRQEINLLKKDLLLRFGVQLQQGLEAVGFDQLASDPLERLKVLDEVRLSIGDQEVRSQLSFLRQQYLDHLTAEGSIDEEQARQAIERARQELAALSGKKAPAAILDRIQFHLDQAEAFIKNGNFSGAFSQSVMAIGAADETFTETARPFPQLTDEAAALKQEFDQLVAAAQAGRLQRVSAPEVYELFDRAEKLIAAIGDGVSSNLEEVKIALMNIEAMINAKIKRKN